MAKLSNSYLANAYFKRKIEYVNGAPGVSSYRRIAEAIREIKPKFSIYDSFFKYSNLGKFKCKLIGPNTLQDLESIISDKTGICVKIPIKKKRGSAIARYDTSKFFVVLGRALQNIRY